MKKDYIKPLFECTDVTVGQFLCDSPGGIETENQGQGGFAPSRTLYV